MLLILLIAQSAALLVLLARLASGRRRAPPVAPQTELRDTTVSIVVTTLNELHRLAPCLLGLRAQSTPMLEVLVIDSASTDGTQELVRRVAREDARFRLVLDDPLPPGWIGKVWALERGLREARGEWVLGVDADTEPQPGMVAGVIAAAREHGLDACSFSPRFAGQTAAEQWLQSALLTTLVYRFGAAGTVAVRPDRVMANGQCFLVRRHELIRHGGYASARRSFCDDVSLARHLAKRGARVGFLDGSRVYSVRSYSSLGEMWREWGRSIDLKDAQTRSRQWRDVAFLLLVQGLPLPLIVTLAALAPSGPLTTGLVVVNLILLGLRALILFPLSRSYDRTHVSYWLSPLADPLAWVRVLVSSLRRAKTWRGRRYD